MANFGRVKTWGAEILQPTDLNAEFDNIINNVTANGLDADNIDETDDYTWSGISVFTNNAAGASGDLLVLTVQTNPASGTATDADGIYMSWKGDDDGGTATEYGRQHLEFDDTGASSEDSSWHLSVMAAATLTDVLTIGHTSAVGTLTLKNQATAVTDGVKLGQINFQAPAESSGTDAILVAASIWAEADDTFAADNNDADLVFAVAESEAAAERMRLAYDGTGTALSFTTATAIDTGGNNALTLNPGTAALTITAGDMTLYDDNNNADASFAIGTSATENLVIAVLNGAANKTAEEVTFTTNTASATADHGKMTFAVDGATVLTIDDGGLSLNGALAIDTGGDNILTLTSGTAHLDVTTGLLDVTGPVTSSGVLSVDDTTETTSGTTGSIHTDGGLGVAKDIYLGDDLLIATGAVFNWAAGDVTLTHAAGKLTFGGDGAVEIDFNNHEMTNVDINSGAIDGTIIGAASAAAGTFTTFTSTGIDDNGTATALTISSGQDMFTANGSGVVIGHSAQLVLSGTPEFQMLGTGFADTSLALGRWSADTAAPYLFFCKSRHATIGSKTIVQADDWAGFIQAIADDGVDFETSVGYIAFAVDGTPGANDMPGRIVFGTTPDGTNASVECLRLKNTGDGVPAATNKTFDWGQAGNAWDDCTADDFVNEADFYLLDDRDDVAALMAIKGSGEYDSLTGFELIDDATLPEWLLRRWKKDGSFTEVLGVDADTKTDIAGGTFSWQRGDVMRDHKTGNPYLSTKTMISWLMGVCRQQQIQLDAIKIA